MKLNLTNLKQLKQNSNSLLTKKVCNYIINKWNDYDDKKHIFTDVLYYGCQSGVVSELIYYRDTIAFYNKHKEEINSLLYELMNNTGLHSLSDLFGNKWDKEDPLANDEINQNLLAWFGFEEALRNVGLQFESLQDCI